jgi:anti-sigma regulatory factor (Ser/Thr protein kinase)
VCAGDRPAVSGPPAAGISAAIQCRASHLQCAAQEVRIAGTVLLPCAPASVGKARQRLAAELTEAGIFGGVAGDAVLVVSELFSNAILHARPLPGSHLLLAWALDEDGIEVAVSDGGATTRPMAAQPTVSSLGGRGLGIVEYLARSWGVRNDAAGLTVWAVVAAQADESLPAPAGASGHGSRDGQA